MKCNSDCVCGRHKWSPERRARHGDNLRGVMLGVPKSEVAKANMSVSAKARGVQPAAIAPEARRKAGITFSKRMTGRPLSEEHKIALSKAMSSRKEEYYTSRHETSVKEALDREGLDYEQQVQIGRYVVDFLVGDKNIVEANGCYWHACTQCECGEHKLSKMFRYKSRKRRAYLERRGFIILEIWEHDMPIEEGYFDRYFGGMQ